MSTLAAVAAPAQILGTIECSEPGCRTAWSRPELCRCTTCNGDAHGIHLRAKVAANRAATLARTSDVFLGAAAPADEVPVLIRRRPVAWCAPCMTTADDCTCAGAA